MYLARRLGGWSLPQIGRFYNGRHHTTVLHAIRKIERLRRTYEAVDALLDVLTSALSPESNCEAPKTAVPSSQSLLVEAVACRVMDRLEELRWSTVPKMMNAEGSPRS